MQKRGADSRLFIYLSNTHLELRGGGGGQGLVFCCFPCVLFFLLQFFFFYSEIGGANATQASQAPPIDLLLYVIRHVIVFLLSRLIGFLGHRIFLLIKVAKTATNCKYRPVQNPHLLTLFFFLFLSIHPFLPTFLEVPFFSVSLTTAAPCLSMPHLFTEPSTS